MRLQGGTALGLAATLLALCGAPAWAQDGDGTVVPATTTSPGLSLGPSPDDRDGVAAVCVSAEPRIDPRDDPDDPFAGDRDAGGSGECGDPTASDGAAVLVADVVEVDRETGASGETDLAGLVPAGAARVVVRARDGRTTAFAVVPVAGGVALPRPVAAFAGSLGAGPGAPDSGDLVEARVERADGTALGVDVLDLVGRRGDDLGGVRSRPPLVRRVRTPAGALSIRTSVESSLRPSAPALERRVAGSCTSFALAGRLLPSRTTCSTEADGPDLAAVSITAICRAHRVVLSGVLAPGATRGTAELTDGRRMSVTPTSVDALPGRRAWSLVAPAGVGVRRLLDVPDRAGSGAGTPPAGVTCGLGGVEARGGGLDVPRLVRAQRTPVPGTPATLATTAPDVPLLAVDGPAGQLCLALGRRPVASDCTALGRGLVAVPQRTEAALDDGRTLVAGVAAAGTTAVEVRLQSGGRLRIATAPAAPGYAGTYAGTLSTFSAVLPRGALPSQARALAPIPGGTGDAFSFGFATSSGGPAAKLRRIGRLPGGLRAYAITDAAFGAPCVALVTGARRPGTEGLRCASPDAQETSVVAEAPCAARRVVVSAVLTGRRAAVAVTDDAGRVHRGRVLPLRGTTALHVVVLGTRTGARSVSVTGATGPPLRRALPAPAGREQCGWAAAGDRQRDASPDGA